MVDSIYCSRNPAPGVKVAPFIGPKVTGLTNSQSKAWRSPAFIVPKKSKFTGTLDNPLGVTPHHLKGGPFVMASRSTVKDARYAIRKGIHMGMPGEPTTLTGQASLTMKSGPKRNSVFQPRIKTSFQRVNNDIDRAIHWLVIMPAGPARGVKIAKFIQQNPFHKARILNAVMRTDDAANEILLGNKIKTILSTLLHGMPRDVREAYAVAMRNRAEKMAREELGM